MTMDSKISVDDSAYELESRNSKDAPFAGNQHDQQDMLRMGKKQELRVYFLEGQA